jgi:hypothetical protein
MRCQAFALMGLVQMPSVAPGSLMEKLANLVGEGFPTLWWWWGTGGFDVVMRLIALADYDKAQQSADPNVHLLVRGTSDVSIVDEMFVGEPGLTKRTSLNLTWDELTIGFSEQPTPITFRAEGTGEISVAMGLTFAPILTSTKPKYFGLFVERKVFLLRTGEELTKEGSLTSMVLDVGEQVEVVLSVMTPDDVNGLILEDFLPGGLEAVDENLRPAVTDVFSLLGTRDSYMEYMVIDPWWSFNYKEVKSDRVVCVATYLFSGTHLCRYYANAVTSGTFVMPASKAYLSKQPEVMGLSETKFLTVRAR